MRSWLATGVVASIMVGCGSPTVTVGVPSEPVIVFRGGEVDFPVTLTWEGESRALSVQGASAAARVNVDATPLAPGTTQAVLTLKASEIASDGELQLVALGEGVEAQATITVTVASASVVAPPSEPVLRGGSFQVELAVTGGPPEFEGVSEYRLLEDGTWRVTVQVPGTTASGAAVFPVTVRAGADSLVLQVPVTVTDTVSVQVVDIYGVGLPGHETFVNGGAAVITDASGRASFSGVTAPYRLTYKYTLAGHSAYSYEGATLSQVVLKGYETNLPVRTASLHVRLEEGSTGALITGHQSAFVGVMMEGQTVGWGVNFVAGGAENTNDIPFRSLATSQTARLRARAWVDGRLAWYADGSATLRDGEEESRRFNMQPPPRGTIHSSVQVPPGFSVDGRTLYAIFAGNRFDYMSVQGDSGAALTASLEDAFAQDDVRHTLQVGASELSGSSISRTWTGLAIGQTAEGALRGPPRIEGVSPSQITDGTVFGWSGESWPVYQLEVAAGEGDAYRHERVYTSGNVQVRPGMLLLPSGTPGSYQVCGTDSAASVDEVLRQQGDFGPGLFSNGSRACDRRYQVTYTAGP